MNELTVVSVNEDAADTKIILLEAMDRVLPAYLANLSAKDLKARI
jgi:hypothetical protein